MLQLHRWKSFTKQGSCTLCCFNSIFIDPLLYLIPWIWRAIYSLLQQLVMYLKTSCVFLLFFLSSAESFQFLPLSHVSFHKTPDLCSLIPMDFVIDPLPQVLTGVCICQQVSPYENNNIKLWNAVVLQEMRILSLQLALILHPIETHLFQNDLALPQTTDMS